MSTIRGGVEQSRERQVALMLLLERAWHYRPLTQEEILRELMIDEYPVSAKGPRKVRAYEGSEGTIRQKFERDKARIRDLGFEIETVALEDGAVGYRVDPASGYAPPLHFTSEELRVVRLALSLCGFGKSGAFSVFHEVAASDGGLTPSNYYTPILRALHLQRAIRFDYFSRVKRSRVVEPLLVDLIGGAMYLVARVSGTTEIKGYRLNRLASMPVVLSDGFRSDDDVMDLARRWRPEFATPPRALDVVVLTNENYATLLARQYPLAVASPKANGSVEVALTFEHPHAALAFVLEGAERVRLRSPKSLRDELRAWLRSVNRGDAPDLSGVSFSVSPQNEVLGQTLRLLHAVYASDDGLRVSDLARRFDLDPAHVRLIMDRLVSLEPMAQSTDGTDLFPAHVLKDCDDWEDEGNDDSIYRADFSDLPAEVEDPSPFMWRDLFELNVALREAARVYREPAILSAIEKIEQAASIPLQVELATNEAMLEPIERAIAERSQVKIEYTAGVRDDPTVRAIEPREVKVLNGHTYVRAYCCARGAWRTFRVDRISAVLATSAADTTRPADDVANWLTHIGEEGDEVVVAVEAANRWLFEPLPGAQWASLDDGRFAVRFRLSERSFLDHLLVRAGAGAVVATPQFADAGHDLAGRIAAKL